MTPSIIGTHKIITPDTPFLDFAEGLKLAEQHILPLRRAVLDRACKIVILVPENRPRHNETGRRSTISAAFFVGLLEDMLVSIRDEHFPQIKPAAARSRIRIVGGTAHCAPEPMDLLVKAFTSTSTTYDPLEKFLTERVEIGLQHQDGTYTAAQYGPGRVLLPVYDGDIQDRLFFWGYKYFKALDGMFSSNLNLRETMARIAAEQSLSSPQNDCR